MTTPTKRSAKAKKLWAYPYEDGDVVTDVPPSKHDVKRGFCRPVFLLPAAPEDVAALNKRLACVIHGARLGMKDPQKSKHFCGNDAECAEAVLRTLGIISDRKP